jgi:hypothetical protein
MLSAAPAVLATTSLAIGSLSLGMSVKNSQDIININTSKVVGPTTSTTQAVTRFGNDIGTSLLNSTLLLNDEGLLFQGSNQIDFSNPNQFVFSATAFEWKTSTSNIVLNSDTINLVATNVLANGSPILTSADFSQFVIGPASATDTAIARYNSTTGKLIEDSTLLLSNSAVLSANSNQIDFSTPNTLNLIATNVQANGNNIATVSMLSNFLPLAGGNMSGDIDMKGNNLKDVDLITYNSGHGLAIGDTNTSAVNNSIAIGSGAVNTVANSILLGNSAVANIRPNNNGTCDLGTSASGFQWLYANSIVTNKQVITPADNTTVYPIDTTKDTILIDTSNFSAQISMTPPLVNKKVTISLLYQRGLAANIHISGISSSFGFVQLNASVPGIVLSYVDGTWYFLNYLYSLGSLLPKNQSTKLVPVGGTGTNGQFGLGDTGIIAISNDGNTIIAGALYDGDFAGSIFIWIQDNAGVWTQQAHITPSDPIGSGIQFGYSCCLSADGNTLCGGGPLDNNTIGALWVFTRAGATWTQRQKLLPTGHGGTSAQLGVSCAISCDGTYIIGGAPGDGASPGNNGTGAAYIYTKTAPGAVTWSLTQRIQGTGLDSTAAFGAFGLRCTSDARQLLIGAWNDDTAHGAAFIFQASLDFTTWTQIGTKIVPVGTVNNSGVGSSIAMNADGSVIFLGSLQGGSTGVIYMYTVSNGVPTFVTSFTGNDTSDGLQGESGIACTADGSYITNGGYGDGVNAGAMWQFIKSPSSTVLQYGSKILPSFEIGPANFGYDLCTTPSGHVIGVYAPFDNTNVGAVFVFQ